MINIANKESPILFNLEMVSAILDGQKSMTRRIVKPPKWWVGHLNHSENDTQLISRKGGQTHPCPFGQPGDRLWVKETWHLCGANNPDGSIHTEVIYRADSEECSFCGKPVKWKPSIFMSREKSRINLQITKIRVESLNDIIEEDAIAEGISCEYSGWHDYRKKRLRQFFLSDPKDSFRTLWNSIHEKTGLGWDTNPIVWVIEFRMINE